MRTITCHKCQRVIRKRGRSAADSVPNHIDPQTGMCCRGAISYQKAIKRTNQSIGVIIQVRYAVRWTTEDGADHEELFEGTGMTARAQGMRYRLPYNSAAHIVRQHLGSDGAWRYAGLVDEAIPIRRRTTAGLGGEKEGTGHAAK